MKNLIKQYDELKNTYGSQDLNSVYGCGEGRFNQHKVIEDIKEILK